MALLQPRLNLKVAQRQVLTPGLMQMVSVLALNKLELKEMIDAEMVENPVLEEIDETVPMLDEVAGRAGAPGARGADRAAASMGRASRAARPRIPSTRSISAPIFRTIWIPAIAPSRNLKRTKGPPLRIFSPSRLLCPITWLGSWEPDARFAGSSGR